MAEADFDLLILGAGSGGYACALRAAQLDLRVGLVEKSKVGGTCLHVGCIPTKALLHAAEVADSARNAERFGVRASFDSIDMPGVNAYKSKVVEKLYKGLTGLISSRGITVIEGEGRMTGPHEVSVGDQTYSAKNLVLASGSTSRALPHAPFDGERILDSTAALALESVPERAVVIGGGVIGAEFASVWRSFGSEVIILEALPRLVANEDEDASKALRRAFTKRGIVVRTDTAVEGVTAHETGVTVTLPEGESIEADVCLVAIGRSPVTEGLGYEDHGVELVRGFTPTDEFCRTRVDNVWAVGDIVPGLQLAHRGFAQGVLVAEKIAEKHPTPIDESGIPRVTYCHPEVASVGLTEAEARERYGSDAIQTTTYDLGGNGKSQILATSGFIKLVRAPDGSVAGIHMFGERVSELIGEAQLIYNWQAHAEDVAPLIHAHPTQNEALGEAHLALAGQPLHAHA